jgi:hypothetical protein
MSNSTNDNSQLPFSHLHFPAKLYQIIEEENDDIISWNDDGLSFRIIDHFRFERELMPKYFRHRNISSVQRQLNLYGFKCVGRGENKGCFFHPDFKRGKFDIVKQIRRNPRNKKSLRDKSSASYFLLSNKSTKNNNNNSNNYSKNGSNPSTTAESSSTNSNDGDVETAYEGNEDFFPEKPEDLFETIPTMFYGHNNNGYQNDSYFTGMNDGQSPRDNGHSRNRKANHKYEDINTSSSNHIPLNVSAMAASLNDKFKKHIGQEPQQYNQTLVNRVGGRLEPNFSDYISNFYSFDQIEANFMNTPKIQVEKLPPPSKYSTSDSVEDLFKLCQTLDDYYPNSQQNNSHFSQQQHNNNQFISKQSKRQDGNISDDNQKIAMQYKQQPLTKQQQQQYQFYTQKIGQKWDQSPQSDILER